MKKLKKIIMVFLLLVFMSIPVNVLGEVLVSSKNELNLADLNLPLVVKERTWYGEENIRITTDGVLQTNYIHNSGVYRPVDIATNVRSVHALSRQEDLFFQGTLLFIKNDNSLWSMGSNKNGLLGDGTGVNKKEPVKILSDVATVGGYEGVYALKIDKTLWGWGNGVYEPKLITDNVVEVYEYTSPSSYRVRKSNGAIAGMSNGQSYAKFPAGKQVKSGNGFCWIDIDGGLWIGEVDGYGGSGWSQWTSYDGLMSPENNDYNSKLPKSGVIAASRVNDGVLFIKEDNSLWGFGSNENGGVGDGTKVPRTTNPVKIADNVKEVVNYSFNRYTTYNGESWTWNSFNPTPQKADGVGDIKYTEIYCTVHDFFMYNDKGRYILNNGNVSTAWGSIIGENVRLPQTITFSAPKSEETTVTPIKETAKPISSAVLFNGKRIAFDAYNINGNNYFKLRDLAYTLNGTAKQFGVGWNSTDNAIVLMSGSPYIATGGEMSGKGAGNKTATPSNSVIFLDEKIISLTAYNIDGNNYFKLRDIGQLFNFGVDWDEVNNTIVIDTRKSYTANIVNNSLSEQTKANTSLLSEPEARRLKDYANEITMKLHEGISKSVVDKELGVVPFKVSETFYTGYYGDIHRYELIRYELIKDSDYLYNDGGYDGYDNVDIDAIINGNLLVVLFATYDNQDKLEKYHIYYLGLDGVYASYNGHNNYLIYSKNDKILNGDLSDFAGHYINAKNVKITLKSDGTTGNDYTEDSITYKIKANGFIKHEDGHYTWSVGLENYNHANGYAVWLYPVGVEVWDPYDKLIIPTDTTKVRLYEGHDFQFAHEMIRAIFYPVQN